MTRQLPRLFLLIVPLLAGCFPFLGGQSQWNGMRTLAPSLRVGLINASGTWRTADHIEFVPMEKLLGTTYLSTPAYQVQDPGGKGPICYPIDGKPMVQILSTRGEVSTWSHGTFSDRYRVFMQNGEKLFFRIGPGCRHARDPQNFRAER